MNFINLTDWTIFPANIAFINWDEIDEENEPGCVIYFSSSAGDGIFNEKLYFRKDEKDYKALAAYFKL